MVRYLDAHFSTKIICSDAAALKLNVSVNCHSVSYSEPKYLHITEEHRISFPRVTLWCNLLPNKIDRQFLFDGHLTSSMYLHLQLQSEILRVQEDFEYICMYHIYVELYFQQDRVSPSYRSNVRAYLDEILPSMGIERRYTVQYLPRSLDITSLNVLWG